MRFDVVMVSMDHGSLIRVFFFKLYAFILLTSTLVPGINYFVVTTHPLHQLQVRKRSSSSCYDCSWGLDSTCHSNSFLEFYDNDSWL